MSVQARLVAGVGEAGDPGPVRAGALIGVRGEGEPEPRSWRRVTAARQ